MEYNNTNKRPRPTEVCSDVKIPIIQDLITRMSNNNFNNFLLVNQIEKIAETIGVEPHKTIDPPISPEPQTLKNKLSLICDVMEENNSKLSSLITKINTLI